MLFLPMGRKTRSLRGEHRWMSVGRGKGRTGGRDESIYPGGRRRCEVVGDRLLALRGE